MSLKDELYFVTKDDIVDQTKTSFGDEHIISGMIMGCRAVYRSESKSVKVFAEEKLINPDDGVAEFWAEYIEGELINKVVFYVDGLTDVWTLSKKGEVLAVDSIVKG